MQVARGHRNVGMAHQALHDVDVLTPTHEARGITVTPTVGKVPAGHRYTPQHDRMLRSLFRDPPLKLPVLNAIGELRTTGTTKPTDVREPHPVR